MTVLHPAASGGYIAAPMSVCPDENVLAQLAHGGVESPSLRATLQAHLDGCQSCRQLVAAVAGGSAPLVPRETFAALTSGTTLGRYRIERLIGVGGMGVLYEAHDTRLERRVALKLMHPSHDDEAGKARLWREAQAMARLSHQNVVNVFDLGEYEGQLFLAMELVEGGTLRDWFKTHHGRADVIARLCDAGEGLAAAHRASVVHRDFKPENVLISGDGRARVTDFGLARPGEARLEPAVAALATGPIDITRTGTMMGTPAYMSPEQLLRQPADARSDQYSFCVTLYEGLYGRRPHDGATLDQVRAQVLQGTLRKPSERTADPVPDRVWAALERGLSVEPGHRFVSMEALLAALRHRPRRNWVPLAAGLAVLTVLVGLARAELRPVATPPAPAPIAAMVPAPPVLPVAPVPPAQPAEREAATADAPAAGTMVLHLGEWAELTIPGLSRIAVGDAAIVEAKAIGNDKVQLIGTGLGATTVLAWTQNGKRTVRLVKVRGGDAATGPLPQSLTLFQGEQRVLTVDKLQRLAIGDTATADVKTIGNNEVMIIGKGEGRTNLLVWTADGKRQDVELSVSGAAAGNPASEKFSLEVGLQKVLAVPGLTRIAIGDASIADAHAAGTGEIVVVGKGPGRTTLLAWSKDGKRRSFEVTVTRITALEE